MKSEKTAEGSACREGQMEGDKGDEGRGGARWEGTSAGMEKGKLKGEGRKRNDSGSSSSSYAGSMEGYGGKKRKEREEEAGAGQEGGRLGFKRSEKI